MGMALPTEIFSEHPDVFWVGKAIAFGRGQVQRTRDTLFEGYSRSVWGGHQTVFSRNKARCTLIEPDHNKKCGFML
jgi:hypothetical protein